MLDTKKPSREPVFVRDYLAEYRTVLASKRTFLSYIRTALAVFAAGLVFIKFFAHPLVMTLGMALLPAGVLIFVQGLIAYKKMKQVIRVVEEKIHKLEAQDH